MKREWLLMLTSVSVTLVVAIGLLRWLAPSLLGLPSDLQLVQLSDRVPPFYEGVFRGSDLESRKFILKDPLTRVRAKPFFPDTGATGPHDLLGFRNRAVPNIADVVVIGDSQTYGNNAYLDENFPSRLEHHLSSKSAKVYAMATGGWGAIQYFDMFRNATIFQPRVVVIAFYTGNDPLESYTMAYGAKPWFGFQPDPTLHAGDTPPVNFPPPENEQWHVDFNHGAEMVFTPQHRLASNMDHPAVKAGYVIMADVAERVVKMAAKVKVSVVFTIIPTKELVYAPKIATDNIEPPSAYLELVEREQANLNELAARIQSIPSATYVDVLKPLQQAALAGQPIYPHTKNGHPFAAGYDVIARALSDTVTGFLPEPPVDGLVAVQVGPGRYEVQVAMRGRLHGFATKKLVAQNGWDLNKARVIYPRQLARYTRGKTIDEADPGRFGPQGSEWESCGGQAR